jgi:pre-mRNA-processing factor 6
MRFMKVFPDRRSLWMRAAGLEEGQGERRVEAYKGVLARTVECCPQSEDLWLRSAEERWLAGNVNEAREVLEY